MYENFFGLHERPFDLTSDSRYLFMTSSHREALSTLEYGACANTGVTLLIGEAGTGKTTLIRVMLEALDPRRTKAIYLNNPMLTRLELFEFLAKEFHLSPGIATSKTRLLAALEHTLLDLRRENVTAALIIDEAQVLPHELLEEIRLLANIETSREKLVPIVLAGQPELSDRLNDTSFRQLKQRIGLRCSLRPLDLVETGAYITSRISIAGGSARTIFTRDAVIAIRDYSEGIPRTISVICHNALINAFALGRRPIPSGIIREVCLELDLCKPSGLSRIPHAPAPDTIAPQPAFRYAPRGLFAELIKTGRRYSFFSQS